MHRFFEGYHGGKEIRTLSKRAVLRAGYGAIIAVLVLSAVEAFRIQSSVSREQLEIYRKYVDEEETLSTLRRNLWLAGNYVRDFFIRTTPEQAEILRGHSTADLVLSAVRRGLVT
jgi:hypothetical protein